MTLNENRELVERARDAAEAYRRMSPVDQALHDAEQRRSFVRGQSGRDPGPDVLASEVQRLRSEVERLNALLNAARASGAGSAPDRQDRIRILYEAMCPPEESPVGGFTRWARWEDIKDSPSVIERYAAGIDALDRASGAGWRPISEAPRDGTDVLLWSPHWHTPATGWTFGSDHWQGCRRDTYKLPPTHFQPLPPPPVGEGGGDA